MADAFVQGGAETGEQGVEGLSEAALRVIDARVAEKWEELWRRGTQAVNQMQRAQNERIEVLEEQVKTFKDRQICLETENDKLRLTVANLAARFATLGAAFQGSLVPPNTSTPSGAPPMTPRQLEASPLPGQQSMASIHALAGATGAAPGLGASLPEVPTFPLLGPPPASPAQPFSLVSSLGLASSPPPPQARTPVALAPQLLTPVRAPEAAGVWNPIPTPVASPTPAQPGPPGSFTITLRKADGVDLGLDVVAQDQVLLVCDVVPDGAVEAWNRQCLNRQSMERMVHVGDQIITVNNVGQDTLRMMEECRASQLLKLCLLHGDRTDGADPGALAAATPPVGGAPGGTGASVLRADADVFVPRGDNATGDESGAASGQATAAEESASSDSAANGPVQRV